MKKPGIKYGIIILLRPNKWCESVCCFTTLIERSVLLSRPLLSVKEDLNQAKKKRKLKSSQIWHLLSTRPFQWQGVSDCVGVSLRLRDLCLPPKWIILHTKWSEPSDQCAVVWLLFFLTTSAAGFSGFLFFCFFFQVIWQEKTLSAPLAQCCVLLLEEAEAPHLSCIINLFSKPTCSFSGSTRRRRSIPECTGLKSDKRRRNVGVQARRVVFTLALLSTKLCLLSPSLPRTHWP